MTKTNIPSPPRGRAASQPAKAGEAINAPAGAPTPPEASQPVHLNITDARSQCECPEGECKRNSIDIEAFFCRVDPSFQPEADIVATGELLKRLASAIVEERGEHPEQFYMGKRRWEWALPEASAFVRMFNLMVNEVTKDV